MKKYNVLLVDKIIKISSGISLVMLLAITALIALYYQQLPPYIPFFNSLPWGTERLFNSTVVIFIPLVVLGVLIVNNILSVMLYAKHTLIARMLSFNSLLFVILGFLAYLQILLLVL